MNGSWLAAGGMFVISAVLWLLVGTWLAAANPSTRLPWFGWPPNRPRGLMLLVVLAGGTVSLGVHFVLDGLWQRGNSDAYGLLWSALFGVGVILVGLLPYVRHNRRVRRAALRSAESQQHGC